VVEEYRAAQGFNADRAEAWLNLGALEARLGRFDRAEAAYERAIQLQPAFMPAYVNLADLYRGQGREEDSERVLREALARQPEVAEVHHALGLLLVRRKRMPEALGELATAAKLEREVPRYTYVHAIALDSTGQHAQARAVLAEAQARFPGDRDILAALVQLSLQAGDRGAAARWAEKLRELDDGAH
jgi:Flp pilus assembly protein TadD